MKTSLEPFVFHVAAVISTEVVENFCKHFLQFFVIACEGTSFERHESVVSDVDGGSVAMTRIGDRVDVALL